MKHYSTKKRFCPHLIETKIKAVEIIQCFCCSWSVGARVCAGNLQRNTKNISELSIGSYGSSVERIAVRAEDVAELTQELVSGDWLNNNETYNKMQDISDWLRQMAQHILMLN